MRTISFIFVKACIVFPAGGLSFTPDIKQFQNVSAFVAVSEIRAANEVQIGGCGNALRIHFLRYIQSRITDCTSSQWSFPHSAHRGRQPPNLWMMLRTFCLGPEASSRGIRHSQPSARPHSTNDSIKMLAFTNLEVNIQTRRHMHRGKPIPAIYHGEKEYTPK